MMCYEGTNIEKRPYYKSELAEILEVSLPTLRKYVKQIEPTISQSSGYNKYSKRLWPFQIEILLKHLAYI